MKTWMRARTNYLLLLTVGAIGISSLTFPARSHAQGNCPTPVQGNNAVYNTTCNSPNSTIVGSSAFIDASTFVNGANTNICQALHFILDPGNNVLPPAGAVIDARGITGTTALTCVGSPWAGIAAYPSTILLPAGTIAIPTTWILPNGTRVIGEGSTNPYDAITAVPQTTIQASSSLTGAMIQFGDSSCPSPGGCLGVNLGRCNAERQQPGYQWHREQQFPRVELRQERDGSIRATGSEDSPAKAGEWGDEPRFPRFTAK